MKVSVCAQVIYHYDVEVPNMVVDFESFCDSADPVYPRIVRALVNKGLNYDANIISIIDETTNEVLY